jgi:hypothetical protein
MGLFDWFKKPAGHSPRSSASLPRFSRDDVRHLFVDRQGLPQVDWGMADLWLMQSATNQDFPHGPLARRALVSAWLEELRDALHEDHQAWRKPDFDGITPLNDALGKRIAATSDRAATEIRRALKPLRGDQPIPPYALVAIKPLNAYLSFKSHYVHSDSGSATSGGFYSRASSAGYPTIAINCATSHSSELVVAHELTHHALVDADLPLWAEEGITQMMEERVCSFTNFSLSRERVAEQHDRWSEDALDMFIEGAAHLSPEDNDQELAYHLSQWAVRSALERNPTQFFRFLSACRCSDPELAAKAVLGTSQADFVRSICGIS